MVQRLHSIISYWRRDTFLQILLIILCVCFIVYIPSLGNQFVDFDDVMLVGENAIIHAFNLSTLHQAFTSFDPELYIPLTFVSYMIEYALVGNHPFLYHFDSLLLHLVSVIFVAFFILLLTHKKKFALLTAALFALHPLQVEAVAWVAARKDVLSTTLFFASLCAYLLYSRRNRALAFYCLSLLLFVLALLSKVSVVFLPAALWLIDWFQARSVSLRCRLVEIVPFLIVAIVFVVIAINGKHEILSAENPVVIAMIGLRALVFSAFGIIFPFHFSPLYLMPRPVMVWTPLFIMSAVLSIGISMATLLPAIHTKAKECTFGWWFFVLCMLPSMMNASKAGDFYITSDRYAYAGAVGLFLMVSYGFFGLVHYYKMKEATVRILIVVVLVILGSLTVAQTRVWHSVQSLSLKMVTRSPDSAIAHSMRGNALLHLSDKSGAMDEYQKALNLRPDMAKSYTPVAMLYQMQGNEAKARELLQTALKIDPTDATSLSQMGLLEYNRGNYQKAIEYYNLSLHHASQRFSLDKRVATYNNLAAAYASLKMFDKELEQYASAVVADPSFYYGYYNMGLNYIERGKKDAALEAFKKSVDINPAFAGGHMRIAIIYAQNGAWSDAKEQAIIVKQLAPDFDQIDAFIAQINTNMIKTSANPLYDLHKDGLGMLENY